MKTCENTQLTVRGVKEKYEPPVPRIVPCRVLDRGGVEGASSLLITRIVADLSRAESLVAPGGGWGGRNKEPDSS